MNIIQRQQATLPKFRSVLLLTVCMLVMLLAIYQFNFHSNLTLVISTQNNPFDTRQWSKECVEKLLQRVNFQPENLIGGDNSSTVFYKKFASHQLTLEDFVSHNCSLEMSPCVGKRRKREWKRKKSRRLQSNCYKHYFNKSRKAEVVTAVKSIVEELQANGFWVAMCGGTLLGSFRHHGFIPWDDDMDFMIDQKDRLKVQEKLEQMAARKEFNMVYWNTSLKFGDKHNQVGVACVMSNKKKVCELLDIFQVTFFKNYIDFNTVKFPIDTILPLKLRPFENEWFPAPGNTLGYLVIRYGKESLKTCTYHNHAAGAPVCRKRECSDIMCWYNFTQTIHQRVTISGQAMLLEITMKAKYVRAVMLHNE